MFKRGNPNWGTAVIRVTHGQVVGHFPLTGQYGRPEYTMWWCHLWTGGPGLYRRAGWAGHQSKLVRVLHGLCCSSCPVWFPAVGFLDDRLWSECVSQINLWLLQVAFGQYLIIETEMQTRAEYCVSLDDVEWEITFRTNALLAVRNKYCKVTKMEGGSLGFMSWWGRHISWIGLISGKTI